MKRYVLVTGDFVTTGGMDRANHALASYLARHGNEVHLVAHRAADDLLALPNVAFHRVPKLANSYFLAAPCLAWTGRCWAKFLATRGARVIVNGGNCQWGDVNWVHYVHAAYDPCAAGGGARRFKAALAHRSFIAAERLALSSSRVVIANSNRTKRDLVDHVGVPAKRIHVVYYGTNPGEFRPANPGERAAIRVTLNWSPTKPVVAFVGALGDHRKGFATLFDAWVRLCREADWQANLCVIGAGAQLSMWRRRAEESGVGTRIHFLGFRSDVAEIIRACDVLVAPTRYEAYGLGVQESLCSAVPALVSTDAGISERYPNGLRRLLLDLPEDVGSLARALRSWMKHADTYRQAAAEGAASLSAHTWDEMAARIESIISETTPVRLPSVAGSIPRSTKEQT